MSWDLYVQDLPDGVGSVAEIPSSFRPGPVCTPAELLEAVSRVMPWADRSDPTWITADGPGFSIEVNASPRENGELGSFALHVRGGDEAIGPVVALLDELGVRALDPQSDSGIFDPATAQRSLARWRAYLAETTRANGGRAG